MKFNYRVLICSIIFTIFSLSGYILFTFINCQPIVIGQDISISIFSSSIFVVITSLVGYLVERHRLLLQLYDCIKNLQIINAIVKVSLVENNENRFDRENIKSIILTQQSEMNKLFVLMNDYYPIKDIKIILKYWSIYNNFLNKKLEDVYFGNRLTANMPNNDPNKFNLSELIEQNSELIKQLKTWLKNKKFIFPNNT